MSSKIARTIIVFLSISLLFLTVLYFSIRKQDYREVFNFIEPDLPISERKLDTIALNNALKYRTEILEQASQYNISPISILGIIVAEASMHSKSANYFEEYFVKNAFLGKDIEYLENLADATENRIASKKIRGESEQEFEFRLRTGLIWTIGICQMSILKAREIEISLSLSENREKRNIKEIIHALLAPNESIKYCAFELGNIRDAYMRQANIDISYKPEILATVYNLGNIENLLEKYKNSEGIKPVPNEFGDYIITHEELLCSFLKGF